MTVYEKDIYAISSSSITFAAIESTNSLLLNYTNSNSLLSVLIAQLRENDLK